MYVSLIDVYIQYNILSYLRRFGCHSLDYSTTEMECDHIYKTLI